MGKVAAVILGMLLLIFDSRTAMAGAQEGIALCLRVVIPSIFPMMLLARLLSTQQWNGPKWLSRIFHLPQNSQALLLAGILCGYPVGAQLVGTALEERRISKVDARRMVCVCSNCGPAFLFGMTAQLFNKLWIPWALWGILLLCSAITSWMIPGQPGTYQDVIVNRASISDHVSASMKAMGIVCSWVVFFRVILNLLERRMIGWLPELSQVVLSGLLELSNGCSNLAVLGNMGLMFVLCGLFMSFGGVCVFLQIIGVARDVDMGIYFPGKVFQSALCVLLTYFLQYFFFSTERFHLPLWSIALLLFITLISAYFLQKSKITSRIPGTVGV